MSEPFFLCILKSEALFHGASRSFHLFDQSIVHLSKVFKAEKAFFTVGVFSVTGCITDQKGTVEISLDQVIPDLFPSLA